MIIAHDLGTTGDKASLHDVSGNIMATVTKRYPTRFGPEGVAEQDPDLWWKAVGEASRDLLARTAVDPADVVGIALSGQMMGAVLLDESLRPTRPAMIWADRRSHVQAARLIGDLGMVNAYAELGHRIDPTYSLSKAMWVRENEPDVWARVRHLCLAKDYVNLRMTGLLVTDPSDASSTNAFDQVHGQWSKDLLDASGLATELLPAISQSTSALGPLTSAAATHLGLTTDTLVVVGGGDGPMAAVGAGVITPSDGAYACLGSSSWISVSTDQPLIDPKMRSMTFNHVVPDRFVPTATMQAGGASLQWIVGLLRPQASAGDFEDLLHEAATVSAADDGLYFLPHILGERSPYWNAAAAGVFAGLNHHHGPAHLVRAVLEGVGFNLRTCVDAFTDGSIPMTSMDAIGGGAKSPVWLQIMADVWGLPVRRRNITDEANSLGAAVTALVGLGHVDSFAVSRELSQVTDVFEPDSRLHPRRVEQHAEFLDAYRRLEPWFDHRSVEQ